MRVSGTSTTVWLQLCGFWHPAVIDYRNPSSYSLAQYLHGGPLISIFIFSVCLTVNVRSLVWGKSPYESVSFLRSLDHSLLQACLGNGCFLGFIFIRTPLSHLTQEGLDWECKTMKKVLLAFCPSWLAIKYSESALFFFLMFQWLYLMNSLSTGNEVDGETFWPHGIILSLSCLWLGRKWFLVPAMLLAQCIS